MILTIEFLQSELEKLKLKVDQQLPNESTPSSEKATEQIIADFFTHVDPIVSTEDLGIIDSDTERLLGDAESISNISNRSLTTATIRSNKEELVNIVNTYDTDLKNPDIKSSKTLLLESIQKLQDRIKQMRAKVNQINNTINSSIETKINRKRLTAESGVDKSIDKYEVSEGEKVIIDVDGGKAARRVKFEGDIGKKEYKQYLIRTASSLGQKKYNLQSNQTREARAVAEELGLTASERKIFWKTYTKNLPRRGALGAASAVKDAITDRIANLKSGITGSIAGGLNSVDLALLNSTTKIGNIFRKRKSEKKKEGKGLFRVATAFVGSIIRNVRERVGQVVNVAKQVSGINKAVKFVKAVGQNGQYLKAGGTFLNSGFNSALPTALVLTLATGGLGPGVLLGAAGMGIAGGSLNVLKDLIDPSRTNIKVGSRLWEAANKQIELADGSMAYSRLGRNLRGLGFLARGFNAGLAGMFPGAIVGGLLGGQGGILIGALAGGGGSAALRIGTDVARARLGQSILAGKTYGAAVRSPFYTLSSQVYGTQLINRIVRLGLGDFGLLNKFAEFWEGRGATDQAKRIRKMTLSEAEREQLTGIFKNPLAFQNVISFAFNSLTLANYVLSFKGIFGQAGFSPWIARSIAPIFNRLGFTGIGTSLGGVGETLAASQISLKIGRFSVPINTIGRGAAVGGILGSVLGMIVASVLGLNIGIAAAVGGTAGAIVGGVVAGGASLGSGGMAIVFAGGITGFFSFAGTMIGSLVDTYILKTPQLFNPLAIFQGISDIIKFFTTPIRDLRDYAGLIVIIIGILNFTIYMSHITGNDTTQNAQKEESTASAINLIYTAADAEYSEDYSQIILNDKQEAEYSFENFDRLEQLPSGKLAIIDGDKYWLIENPGKYVYNPSTNKLAGKGQAVSAAVYQNQPQNLSSASSSTSVKGASLTQLNFCDLYTNLCND